MTLLELLVVIALLSVVGFMALSQVGDDLSQVRYEDTHNRLGLIRGAVIGDTARTLNGQPEIRGFVADMGRLPANLHELIEREFCSSNPLLDQAACTGGTATWTSMPAYAYDATAGLWAGWNGPYLNASPESDYPRFRDGWGNDDGSNDFGWVFAINGDALELQSFGVDGVAGGSTDYEAEYPPDASKVLIAANEYRTLITDSKTTAQNDEEGGITVDFGSPAPCWTCSDNSHNTRAACEGDGDLWSADTTITDQVTCEAGPPGDNGHWQPTERLCLRIGYRSDGAMATLVSSGDDGDYSLTWDGSAQTARFAFEDTSAPHDEDTYLPMGQMAYRVFFHDGTDCSTGGYPTGSEWRPFSLVPGSVLHPLPWAVH